jgi:hypothetical protein
VYARPVRRPGRVRSVAVTLSVAIACAACRSTTSDQQAASLCEDLQHLRATVEVLARTPPEATVGQVRSALEKLDPTFDEVGSSSLVSDTLRRQLGDARAAYGDAIEHVGDDDPASEVAADVADARLRLDAAYTAIVGELGCGGSPSGSGA